MAAPKDQNKLLRSAALKNARSILLARRRAEDALLQRTEELAHSLSLMKATLESTTDGILVTDEMGRMTGFNEKFLEMYQLPQKGMADTDHEQLLELTSRQMKDPAGFLAAIRDIYAAWPLETFHVLEFTDGRVFERYSKIQRVGDRNVGRVWSYHDITQRQLAEEQLRQQREWLRVTLTSIGDAVITTDTRGKVTFLNPVAERMTGWNSSEAGGKHLEMIFRIINEVTRKPAVNPVNKVLLEGVPVALANHTALIARDGTEIAIEDSAAPITDAKGKIIGAVMVFHDVTERRRAEESLKLLSRLPAENPAPVLRVSGGRILAFANHAALEHLAGLSMTVGEVAPPEILQIASRATKGSVEVNLLERTYHIVVMPVVEADYVNLYFTDITSRKRLEMERERLAGILERSLNEIYIFDTENLRFEYANEGALRNLGYSLEEMRQKTPLDLKPEFTEASFREMVRSLLETKKEKLVFYTVHRRHDGTHYPVEVHLQLATHAGQRVFLAIILDITERKKAEEELHRNEAELRALADSMPQLAWIAEPDGHVFWYNRQWYDYTGTTLEQMKGWGWQSVHDPKMLPVVMERWTGAIRTGKSFEMEFPLRGADGTFRRFLNRARPVWDKEGRVLRWFGTNTDVERGKQVEEELAAARELAEKANQAKDQFLAALSHELRTPLTPVLALLSNLCEEPSLPPGIAHDLATMRRNVELEARLIDDLLDLTRVARGKLDLKLSPVRLEQVIEDAIETCAADLKSRRHTLRREIADPDQTFLADGARITQILWNLLKNSIKFTPENGTITIRAYVQATGEAKQMVIEVQDTGIGIEPGDLQRVFEAFEQGDRKITRQFGGLGLGLAISKAIAGSHGGVLSGASDGAGCGSTFTLTFPFKAVEENGVKVASAVGENGLAQPTGVPAEAIRSLRILLVEDHVDTANSLSFLLTRRGHAVRVAGDVASALKLAATQPFDLLLSDLGLPDATGYELMRRIREHSSIPGIALSGYGMDEDIRNCHEAGFSGHLVKPVKISQLEEALARVAPRSV